MRPRPRRRIRPAVRGLAPAHGGPCPFRTAPGRQELGQVDGRGTDRPERCVQAARVLRRWCARALLLVSLVYDSPHHAAVARLWWCAEQFALHEINIDVSGCKAWVR